MKTNLVVILLLLLSACAGTASLTDTERQKLDPQLLRLFGDAPVNDSEFDSSLRSDGTKEYGVIIRSKNVDEIKLAGIQVGSAFGDVITARVSLAELKKILNFSSVRAVQASSKNHAQ